jgi:coenzyme F420 hydrogenase subunit beta
MNGRIRTIKDVVDWGLCVGCGACHAACDRGAVTLRDVEEAGIRPSFADGACSSCSDCLTFCPGLNVDFSRPGMPENALQRALYGGALEVWEGRASDPELCYRASSGGAITAISAYCLERKGMGFVLHTAMDQSRPWINRTVTSRSREELLARVGSRYSPASPCDGLGLVESSGAPCVFVGKPCDNEAVAALRKRRRALDENVGLAISLFCAGTPSTAGTLALLRRMNVDTKDVETLHYRGDGWPGSFRASGKEHASLTTVPYDDSWGFLNKHIPFRCHLCPDGTGQMADISCGDAWHRHSGNGDIGRSVIVVRTERGREILRGAAAAGYLDLAKVESLDTWTIRYLIRKRKSLFGRLFAMRAMMVPVPRFQGIPLFPLWRTLSADEKARSVLGTAKRIFKRGLWHRNTLR